MSRTYLNNESTRSSTDIRIGTIDSWIAWKLTNGAHHVTDHSNAAVTGLTTADARQWRDDILVTLGITREQLPTIVPSRGLIGEATALPGAPVLAALVGDQQASLVGQGCVSPGRTKITFGSGGMLTSSSAMHRRRSLLGRHTERFPSSPTAMTRSSTTEQKQ